MRTRHFLTGVSTSTGDTWNYVKIESDTWLSCSPIVVTKSSQFNKAACVTVLRVMGNWRDSIFLLPYTFSISSPLLTSLQQLLIAFWRLSRCVTAFYTPFLRSFLLSKTLAPSSVNLSSSWQWLQLSCCGRVWLLETPWTVACQAPQSMGLSGKNTGVSCCGLFRGIFLTQGSDPHLLHLLHWQVGSLPLVPSGKPMTVEVIPNPLFQGSFTSDQFLTFIEMTDSRFWCTSLEVIGDFVHVISQSSVSRSWGF